MNDLIKIKCPNCSTILTVRNLPGIETKSVKCPVCQRKSRFVDFATYTPPAIVDDPGTDTGGGSANFSIGRLVMLPEGNHFQLKMGRNVIGRKANTSKADIQIPVNDPDNRMSREHLIVDVSQVPGKGIVHNLSLYKEQVNETRVNNNVLEYRESIPLAPNAVIQMPGNVSLRFEIVNNEKTGI